MFPSNAIKELDKLTIIFTVQETLKSKMKSFMEQSLKTKYILNSIITEINSEQNDDNKNDINFVKYNETATKHEDILNEWNINTNKLNNILSSIQKSNNILMVQDEKQTDIGYNGTKLYDKYSEFCDIMNEQSNRLHQTTSNNHIKEIMRNQKELAVKIIITKHTMICI